MKHALVCSGFLGPELTGRNCRTGILRTRPAISAFSNGFVRANWSQYFGCWPDICMSVAS
jgi:hypothetical protein